MAGKNVQYNLQIHADSTQAKRQLEDLSTTLSKISSMHIKTVVEDSAIEKASEAAKELQKHLQGATNVDTGKLNLTAFNKSLTNANTSVSELSRSLLEAGTLGQQAFTQLTAAIANTEVPIRQVNKTLQTWGTTLKNTAKWEISSTVVHGLESALSGAVGYARDLNKSLTDIRIVTGQSVEDMSRFAAQANRAAKELSTSTKAYANAALIYYQQGDSDEVVAQKAAITLKAANASFKTSASEMSEYLTAVWNSYQVGADELERYVDIMAALGAKTATSLEEIATSMQKVAATGNTVGISMEQVSSIIATVSSVTRESAESIGTSYKTIFARIGDLKLGKTDEEGIGLGQVSSALDSIGIDILDASGNLRDMGDIITDLGDKWQTMTEAQKTATAQVVAGKRQYTQLMALFENWDMYKENVNIAENSEGALQNMQNIYADSWESASKRVQAALEGIYGSLLNDQAFIKVLNFVEKIVESIGGMVDGFGGVKGIIFNIGGLMSNLFSTDIAQGMTKAFTTVAGLFKRTGTAQEQYLEQSRRVRAELEASIQDNTLISQGTAYETSAIIEVMKVKEQMTMQSKSLTAEQQTHIEGVISAYQKEVAAITEVQKAQDKMKMDADIQEEQLKSKVLQEEMRSVAKRSGTTDYELLDRGDREAAYKLAQETLISDTLNLDLEVDVKLDNGQVKKEVSTVEAELSKVFSTTKGLTFDKLVSESKLLTTQLGQTKNVLAQLKAMTGENGIDLFAANKSTEEIMSDLQHMANAYKEITGGDLQFEVTGLNGVKEQIVDLGAATNLTKEQMQEVATQMVQHFSNLENTIAQKVTAIKNVLLRIVPPELQGEFQRLFAKWEEMAILGESSSHRIEKGLKDALARMNEEVDKTFSKMSQKIKGMVKVGSALSSIGGIIRTISSTIDTLKDPDASGWVKFGAVISTVATVLMSMKTLSDGIQVVMKGYNGLVAIGTGLEIVNTAAKKANADATGDKTDAIKENMTIEDLKQLGADGVKEGGIFKNLKRSAGGVGQILKGMLPTLGKVGSALLGVAKAAAPWLALAAAVAAVGYAVYRNVTATERRRKELAEETKELKKSTQENKERTNMLISDTAQLASIMRDTTLTYEQQIEKINEIAKAYGVQTDAVDALTGSYGRFASQLITVMQAKTQEEAIIAAENAQASTANYEEARWLEWDNSAADKDWQKKTETFSGYTTYEDYVLYHQQQGTTPEYDNAQDFYRVVHQWDVQNTEEAAKQWEIEGNAGTTLFDDFNRSDKGAGRGALLADSNWTRFGWERDGNISGINRKTKKDNYFPELNDEGYIWHNADFMQALKQYGFYFDPTSMTLNDTFGSQQDYAGLYQFLEGYSELAPYINDENSYTGQIMSIMREKAFVDQKIMADQRNADAQAMQALWQDSSFVSNIFNANASPVDLETTKKLIESVSGENANLETAKMLAETLSQYAPYSDSGKILDSAYDLADAVVELNPVFDLNPELKETAAFDIIEWLMKEFPELDLETVLRISPTDIELEFDEQGNYQGIKDLPEEVKAYLSSSAIAAKQKTIRTTLSENKNLFTAETLTDEDYKTIKALEEAGKLGSDFDTDSFVRQSQATRAADIARMEREAMDTETEALDAQLTAAKARESSQLSAKNDWITQFNASEAGKAMSFESRSSAIAKNNTEIEQITALLEEYEQASDQEKKDFDWENYGNKDQATARVSALRAENQTHTDLIQEGIELEASYQQAITDRQNAESKLDGNKFYQSYTQKVEDATKAVNGFSKAISNTLTAEELAELSVIDPNIMDKYNTDEWTQYAYDSAMKYYADLEVLYAEDAYMLAEIAQQKQETNRAYYAEMSAISQAAYNRERTQLQQTLEDRKEATAAMSETLQEGNLSSQQRLALGDKASAWESATEKERLSMYGAALGQETLAQIELNDQAKGMSQSAIESRALLSTGLGPINPASGVAKEAAAAWQKEFTEAMTSTDEGALEAFFGENMDVFDEATRQIFLNINKQTKGASLSASEIWDLYLAELNKVDDANDQVWASFEDNAVKAIMATIEAEQQAAQEIVDIWKQAIKDIHAARMGLADGQSVAQTFANDEEGLANVVAQLKAQGKTDDEISALINSQDADKSQLTTSNLSMKEFGASQGVTSAVNTESGNLIQNFDDWLRLVKNRIITQANDLFANADAETKEAFEKWKSKNGGGTFADYLMEAYGLNDESQARDLYNQQYGEAWVHRNMYGVDGQSGTVKAQQAFDEATTRYNNTVSDHQSRADDWQAIIDVFEVTGTTQLPDLIERLGTDAAGIMSRLGLSESDMQNMTLSRAEGELNTENVAIRAAEVTLQGDLEGAGLIDTRGQVSDSGLFMEDEITGTLEGARATSLETTFSESNGPRVLTEQETYDYLSGLDSQFSALDAFEADASVENLLALRDALDMTNPLIAEYFNAVASAETEQEREAAIDDLTTAILNQNDAQLTTSESSELLLRQFEEQYGITDEYGEVLTVAALNQMRLAKAERDTYKQLKSGSKVLKANGREYDNLSDGIKDLSNNAKRAGKSLGDFVDEAEDMSDTDKEVVKTLGNMYDAFEELEDEFGDTNFGENFLDQCLNAEEGTNITGLAFDAIMDKIGGEDGWSNVFDGALTGLQDGTYQFSDAAMTMINNAGLDVTTCMTEMQAALEAAGGNWGLVDWGTLANTLGVDMSWITDMLTELLNAYIEANNIEGVDVGALIGQVQNALQAASAVQNKYGGGGGGALNNNTSPSKSGGGGGSGSKEKKDYKRFKDENERYHVQNETLDRIGEQLDKIDKLKDQTYGRDHIAQLDAETEALRRQYDAQVDLYNEAMKWKAADQAELISLGVGVQFDENGTISNYEEVIQKLLNKYNAAVDQYNNSEQGDGDKLRLEDAEEAYDDAIQAIENYEEAVETANQAQIDMEEILNNISEIELEKITYELEIDLEVNERDIELLEYFQEKYSEILDKQDDVFNSLVQTAHEYESNLGQLHQAYNDLVAQYANGNGPLQEDEYAEGLADLSDQILENLSNLKDLEEEIAETYSNTLELARDEIDQTLGSLEHFNSAMQSYITIAGLSGKAFFELNGETVSNSFKGLETFYDAQFENNMNRILIQKEHLDVLLEEETRFRDKIESGQQLTNLEKEQYAALQEQIQETREGVLSATEETLETLQEGYENTINGIAEDLDNFMAGSAGSLAHLADQYAYFQEEQSRYVSTAKELYEVSSLTRDIEGSIADASSKASKEALKALQEKIEKQSELNELTEYDIQMNQLQYQLLLARIQLEEAQNAKDTVRLTRDDNGNYAYQYTADQGKVDEALQNYEDVLQQINDLTTQRTSEIEQQMIDAMQSYKDQFQEIALDQTLTAEQRNERLMELNNRFSETMTYLQEQNGIVTENLTYNQEAIAEHYGVNMAEITASTAGNVNETVQSMIDKTEEYIAAMNAAIFGEDGASSAWQEYAARIGLVNAASGTSYEDMINNTEEMGDMNQYATEEALNTIQTLEQTLEPLGNLTEAWNEHNSILQDTISYYEQLANTINQTMATIGEADTEGGINIPTEESRSTGGGGGNKKAKEFTAFELQAMAEDIVQSPQMSGYSRSETFDEIMAAAYDVILQQIERQTMLQNISPYTAGSIDNFNGNQELLQEISIQADFPNATDQNEIIEAFETLINRAAQFASRKKY